MERQPGFQEQGVFERVFLDGPGHLFGIHRGICVHTSSRERSRSAIDSSDTKMGVDADCE